MLGKSHVVTGALSWATVVGPVAYVTDAHYTPVAVGGGLLLGAIGGIMPDIDAPGALITRGWLPGMNKNILIKAFALIISIPFRLMSHFVHGVLGHRGGTHSLAMTAVVSLLTALLVFTFQGPLWIVEALTLGILAHIASDSVTKSGCPWFWPFSDTHHRVPVFFGYITTGTKKEEVIRYLVFWPLLILFTVVAIYHLEAVQNLVSVYHANF
jgi:membrane-bound metal-dependent hydrolase YbcI (DUF457 family)